MTREEAIKVLDSERKEYIVKGCKLDKAIDIAIKALQGDMYCPSCGVRLVPENEYIEPTQYKGGDDE